jgi:hypothetical protein
MTPCVGEDGKVRPEQAPFIEQMLFQRFYDDEFAAPVQMGADGLYPTNPSHAGSRIASLRTRS